MDWFIGLNESFGVDDHVGAVGQIGADAADLGEALGLVERASPGEFGRSVGFNQELAASLPAGLADGVAQEISAESLTLKRRIDGEPGEPDVLRRPPKVAVQADKTDDPGKSGNNIVGPAIIDTLFLASEVKTEGLIGLPRFFKVHGAPNEANARADIRGRHSPQRRRGERAAPSLRWTEDRQFGSDK